MLQISLPTNHIHEDAPVPLQICNCHSEGEECQTYIARERLAKLGPRLAVEAAAKEPPDSAFISELVNATLKDPRYRFHGVSSLYIRQILEGRSSGKSKRHWEQPAAGIVNVFAGISKSRLDLPEDAAIRRELYSSYSAIIDVISKDFTFLTHAGNEDDSRRRILSTMISWFLHEWHVDPLKKKQYFEPETVKLVLHCWLYTPPDSPGLEDVVRPVTGMFPPPDSAGKGQCPEDLQLAFDSLKATTLVSQFNFFLKNKTLNPHSLGLEISAVSGLINGPFFPFILEAKVHKHVIAAVRKQLKEENENAKLEVLTDRCGVFVQCFFKDATDQIAVCTDLLANTYLIEVGAEALKLAHQSHSYEPIFWPHLFKQIEHGMTCGKGEDCEVHPTSAFIAAARSSLERIATPTLLALHPQTAVCMRDRTRFFLRWKSIVSLLGITEEKMRRRHRADRKCCNLQCPTRNFGEQINKKSTCMRCKSVFYCDRSCQKSDWSIHKKECEMLARALVEC